MNQYRYCFKVQTPQGVLPYDIVAGSYVEASRQLRTSHPEIKDFPFTQLRQTIENAMPAPSTLRRHPD